jgi:hypothetical protein
MQAENLLSCASGAEATLVAAKVRVWCTVPKFYRITLDPASHQGSVVIRIAIWTPCYS